MNSILKQVSFFKTIWFNLKMFPIKKALTLPVFIGRHTKFVALKGKIEIKAALNTGMIKIGFGSVGIIDKKYTRTLIELNGLVNFKGKAFIGNGSKISVGKDGILQLGERFGISANSTIICFDSVTLGDDVLFSWDVLVMDTDFHETENIITNETNLKITRPISLGNNTWVGTRSIILKGTQVPQNTIIAANSLLNKKYSIDENCVLGGIPARVVKRNMKRKL